MTLRALWYFGRLLLIILVAVWLAERPGKVVIDWGGYQLVTTVGALAFALLATAALTLALSAAWRTVRHAPARIARQRRSTRRGKAREALTQGLVAVAAGDAEAALKHLKRAAANDSEPALTHLLSAQSAQLLEDDATATQHYTALMDEDSTYLVGLRGLIEIAQAHGRWRDALALVDTAHAHHTRSPWLARTEFELAARLGLWDRAEIALTHASRQRALSPAAARRHELTLAVARAESLAAAGNRAEAVAQAQRAADLDPAFAPASVALARLLAAEGRDRPAERALERAWSLAPDPALADAWGALGGAAEAAPLRIARYERLLALDRTRPEALLALAEANLDAGLWGAARARIAPLLAAQPPDPRAERLKARIDLAEHRDEAAARRLLDQGAEPADLYACTRCGAQRADWSPHCPACGAFDTLERRTARPGVGPSAGPGAGTGVAAIPAAPGGGLAAAE